MNYAEHKEILKKDLLRWNGKKHFSLYFTKPDYKLVWRLRWCQFLRGISILKPLYFAERLLYHHQCRKCGCDIPSSISVGAGFQILHSWGIVVNSSVSFGENCTLISGALIGRGKNGVPKVGNNVYFGAHSIAIGDIEIGDNVIIGAGAVVTRSVPNDSVMVGEKAHDIAHG